MKRLIFALCAVLVSSLSFSADQPDHSIWERLLQANVSSSGKVNYNNFKIKQDTLDAYLKELKDYYPNKEWTKNEKKAYYMNAYNAYTIKFVIRRYPVESVKDVKFSGKDIWNTKLVFLGTQTFTLKYVEDNILRKMGDPRIHFGINCASFSCPKLYNHAFTGDNVNSALTKLTKAYVNDEKHNVIKPKKLQLSEIFKWYLIDFTEEQTLIEWLNKYSKVTINADAKIEYLPYNWSIND
ncbi:MAG: DUF547 domain-containing protein [Crocinitomicaceae bacterium]|nr:DUF547 domain-containing protein [Crocinitomicaceae bacterium]